MLINRNGIKSMRQYVASSLRRSIILTCSSINTPSRQTHCTYTSYLQEEPVEPVPRRSWCTFFGILQSQQTVWDSVSTLQVDMVPLCVWIAVAPEHSHFSLRPLTCDHGKWWHFVRRFQHRDGGADNHLTDVIKSLTGTTSPVLKRLELRAKC